MTAAGFLYRYANAALECCWLVAAALVPLFMDLLRSQPAAPKGLCLQLLVLLMALLWLVQQAAARAEPVPERAAPGLPSPLGWLAVACAATTLLSAALSPLPSVSFWGSYLRNEGALATTTYIVLFLIVADRLRDRAQFDRLVNVLLATTLAVCLYGLAQALRLDPLPWGRDISARVISTAGNALFLANYLLLVLPLTAWRLVQSRAVVPTSTRQDFQGPALVAGAVVVLGLVFVPGAGHLETWWAIPAVIAAYALVVATAAPFPATPGGQRLRRLAYLALLLLELAVLLLSASIGPLGALVGAPLLVAAVALVRQRRWRQLLAVGCVALFVVVGLVALIRPGSPLEPLKTHVTLLQRLAVVGSTGAGPRGAVWGAATEALTHLPALGSEADSLGSLRPLVGYGPETVAYVLNRFLPPPRNLDLMLGEFWDRSHNATLDRLLTTGLLGLAAYAALVLGIVVVAVRRATVELDERRLGPHLALALALIAHLLETQLSMLILPAEAIFWLLAGVAVGARWEAAPAAISGEPEPAPAREPAGRRARARAPRAEPEASRRWLPLGGYTALVLVLAVALLGASSIRQALEATAASVILLAVGPFAAAFALVPGPRPRAWPGLATGLALLAIACTLLLGSHQVRALAADVPFKRAEAAQASGDYGQAIVQAQEAARLAPDQPEYYFVLGQYYAALGGRTRSSPVPGFEPTLQEALTTSRATILGRDQLFELGRLSLEEAIRRIPLEARYHSTLGELYRYWGEVANEPAHLGPALASFQRAADLKPNDVEIHAGIADTLLLRDDPARAVESGEHARDLLPTYWYPYSVLARAYRKLQWDAAAHDAAEKALSLARNDLGFKSASSYDLEQLRQIVEATRSAAS